MESDEETQLMEWDPNKLPIDIKRDSRREWHYWLWLNNNTYAQIHEITGFHRHTVAADIKWIIERLGQTPVSMESIRQMALMSLRITRTEIFQDLLTAREKNAKPQEIAKLHHEMVEIDKVILQRYTQTTGKPIQTGGGELDDTEYSKYIVDFFKEKYGPECLEGLNDYIQMRMAQKDRKIIEPS